MYSSFDNVGAKHSRLGDIYSGMFRELGSLPQLVQFKFCVLFTAALLILLNYPMLPVLMLQLDLYMQVAGIKNLMSIFFATRPH